MKRFFALLVLALAAPAITGCKPQRTPSTYELPPSFRGWAVVEFRRPECPPLPQENGRVVYRFDTKGRLCTSSDLLYGWASDEYWFTGPAREPVPVTSWGGGGMIWSGSNGECGGAGTSARLHLQFFVGTEAEFHREAAKPGFNPCKE